MTPRDLADLRHAVRAHKSARKRADRAEAAALDALPAIRAALGGPKDAQARKRAARLIKAARDAAEEHRATLGRLLVVLDFLGLSLVSPAETRPKGPAHL